MRLVEVRGLPEDPLEASGAFLGGIVPDLRAAVDRSGLCIAFDPADHTHTGWRLAAVQSLAREMAPVRVNAVASGDGEAIAAALAYLGGADGVTGQYLPLDGHGAGSVVG